MAVTFDIATESSASDIGSASEASFTWSHNANPGGGQGGVLIFTFVNANADNATSVTYGGVGLTAVTNGRAVDTVNETGDCKAWFLGTGVPSAGQTVVVNRTNNSNVMYGVAITVFSSIDTEVTGVALLQENQALAEQSIDDGSPGTNSLRFAGTNSGLATHPAAGANSTEAHFFPNPSAQRSISTVRETTGGQGSRSVGFSASTDDVAAVHLAVREIPVVTGVANAMLMRDCGI